MHPGRWVDRPGVNLSFLFLLARLIVEEQAPFRLSMVSRVFGKKQQQHPVIYLFADVFVCFAPRPQTMAKVITSMLKFSPDQAQKVLDKEDSKAIVSICSPPQRYFHSQNTRDIRFSR